jgi:hypothetical protein
MRITPEHLTNDKYLIGIDTDRLPVLASGRDQFNKPMRVYCLNDDYALVEEYIRANRPRFYRADREEAIGYIARNCHFVHYS